METGYVSVTLRALSFRGGARRGPCEELQDGGPLQGGGLEGEGGACTPS